MLFGYSNAFYDTASIYPWEKVYMQAYVKGLLDELSVSMDQFSSYKFYFLHATEGIIPDSINDMYEKKILIQTGDQSGNEPAEKVMKSFLYIFKTHLRYQTDKYKNLASYPLGLPSDTPLLPIKKISDRKYDVFYSGNLNNNRLVFYESLLSYQSHGIKWTVARIIICILKILCKYVKIKNIELKLKSLIFRINCYNFDNIFPKSYIRFTRAFQAGLNIDDYAKKLSESKIVLSPKGFFNTECFRLYEALRQGCIVITEPQPKKSRFYDKSRYIEIDKWDNIGDLISKLLKDNDKLQSMSDVGVKYFNDCLSPKGVAHYVIETLSQYKR